MSISPENMSDLVFLNTLTKRREVFVPRDDHTVKLFTCGPSVYRRQHLGNYRTFCFEDVLQKYLEYRGYTVERCINYTDVEDKAIREAQEKDVQLHELTKPVVDAFLKETELLNIKLPDEIPRATNSIQYAVKIIQELLERGIAYWHEGNVYYDPLKHGDFGRVFGLDMSKWPKKRYRFSKDTYTGMRWNLGDFILWHGRKEGEEVYWETALGQGRPAWNVQDAAMIVKTLGYQIDIHTGGIDNVYRHHDYNRAVLEGASGEDFCHYWMHGEHLIVDGEKMSKSKGNTLYAEEMQSQGYTPDQIRFLLIYGYYREKLNVTEKKLRESRDLLDDLQRSIHTLIDGRTADAGSVAADKIIRELPVLFETNMNNDHHVKGTGDALHDALKSLLEVQRNNGGLTRDQRDSLVNTLNRIDTVLGVLMPQSTHR